MKAWAQAQTSLNIVAPGRVDLYDNGRLVATATNPAPAPGFAWLEDRDFRPDIQISWRATTGGRHALTAIYTGSHPCCTPTATATHVVHIDEHATRILRLTAPSRLTRGRSAAVAVTLSGGDLTAGGRVEIRHRGRLLT